jgi:hypothetical protein
MSTGGLWRCPRAMITRRWKEEERENFGRRVLASGVGESCKLQLCWSMPNPQPFKGLAMTGVLSVTMFYCI